MRQNGVRSNVRFPTGASGMKKLRNNLELLLMIHMVSLVLKLKKAERLIGNLCH